VPCARLRGLSAESFEQYDERDIHTRTRVVGVEGDVCLRLRAHFDSRVDTSSSNLFGKGI
jgi:hypothetical protein